MLDNTRAPSRIHRGVGDLSELLPDWRCAVIRIYAHQGTVTKPQLTEQTEQAWCLTVLTNSVIPWTTK